MKNTKEKLYTVLLRDRNGNEREEGPLRLETAEMLYAESAGYPFRMIVDAETGKSYY